MNVSFLKIETGDQSKIELDILLNIDTNFANKTNLIKGYKQSMSDTKLRQKSLEDIRKELLLIIKPALRNYDEQENEDVIESGCIRIKLVVLSCYGREYSRVKLKELKNKTISTGINFGSFLTFGYNYRNLYQPNSLLDTKTIRGALTKM